MDCVGLPLRGAHLSPADCTVPTCAEIDAGFSLYGEMSPLAWTALLASLLNILHQMVLSLRGSEPKVFYFIFGFVLCFYICGDFCGPPFLAVPLADLEPSPTDKRVP